ncbi:hypothetical protein Tco_1275167 [Tanacetum coccineum]
MVTSVSSDDMLFDVHHNRLPKCDIEIGLKLIENDSDLFAMYEYVGMYGILDMYVAHIPKKLEDFYFRNLCLDGSGDEVICDHFVGDSVEVEMHAPRVADKGKAKMLDDELVVKRRKANVKNKGIVIEENKNLLLEMTHQELEPDEEANNNPDERQTNKPLLFSGIIVAQRRFEPTEWL